MFCDFHEADQAIESSRYPRLVVTALVDKKQQMPVWQDPRTVAQSPSEMQAGGNSTRKERAL